jgi:hypothetical protein
MFASERAIVWTPERTAARIAALEAAGPGLPNTVLLDTDSGRNMLAEDDANHLERLHDPWYPRNIWV